MIRNVAIEKKIDARAQLQTAKLLALEIEKRKKKKYNNFNAHTHIRSHLANQMGHTIYCAACCTLRLAKDKPHIDTFAHKTFGVRLFVRARIKTVWICTALLSLFRTRSISVHSHIIPLSMLWFRLHLSFI